MINEVKKITEGVLGLALWREDWNTYINCYAISDEKGYILIDTGDNENREGLAKLLQQHDIDINKVHTIIATHGHKDHVGNISLFPNADSYVHFTDRDLVENNEDLKYLNDARGIINGLEWKLTGGHTPGSISIYDRKSKVLFIGDIICFFGVPLPDEGLVSKAGELREMWLEFVKSGEFSKALKSQNIYAQDFGILLKSIADHEIDYLCTGHGVVLEGDIPLFLNNTADELLGSL